MPLLSLGSMFYEPVWLFYRDEAAKKLNKRRRDRARSRSCAACASIPACAAAASPA